jgi:anti-sigma B factor antagonist
MDEKHPPGTEIGCRPKERVMSSHPTYISRFEIDDELRIVMVSLTGDLDPSAVEDLHPQIQELVGAGYCRFIFDLSALDHLGSIALRLFVALAKQVKRIGDVALCNPADRIQSLIELTKVDRVLRTFSTRGLALAALRNPGCRRAPLGLARDRPLISRFASAPRRRPHRP